MQGPSSNHFLFRALSSHFAASLQNQDYRPSVPVPGALPATSTEYEPTHDNRPNQGPNPESGIKISNIWYLPNKTIGDNLIEQYFATIGVIVPFIDRSDLLSKFASASKRSASRSRPLWSLLNIIFAHASICLATSDPFRYYHRTLHLLDQQTLRGSSIELGGYARNYRSESLRSTIIHLMCKSTSTSSISYFSTK